MSPGKQQEESPLFPLMLFAACAALAVLPLLWRGNSCGQDFDFHLQSWMEAARQWQHGIFAPHWAVSPNYQAGEPRFVFYPPLSWTLGALLGLLLPWRLTAPAFIALLLFAAGASFYRMAREWIPRETAAFAACLYLLNPYLLFVAYERSAFGELLAAVWIPLLVLYALRERGSVLPLALIVAALWLTNAPSAVMSCYALALLAGVRAWQLRTWQPAIRAAVATPLGIAMAAFYLLPAAWERRWVEIERAIGPGMRVEDSFLFGHTGELYHDQVLHVASWIAVSLIAAAVLAAACSRRRSRTAALLWPLAALAFCVVLLLLPFSLPLWHLLPELQYLQFPWRLLLLLGLCAATFAAGALPSLRLRLGVPAALLFAVGMVLLAHFFYRQPCDEQDRVPAQIATFRGEGFEGTDEYTPRPADNSLIQPGLPVLQMRAAGCSQPQAAGRMRILAWGPERIEIAARLAAPACIVLRRMAYPAWRVEIDNRIDDRNEDRNVDQIVRPQPRADGLLAIPLPAGDLRVTVTYRTTPDVRVGRAVSMAAWALWATLAWNERRRKLQLS